MKLNMNKIHKGYSTVKLSHKIYEAKCKREDNASLIIIHGLFGSKKNWHTVAKSFSTTGNFNVITVDVRNHGSSPQTEYMDYHVMSADIEKLIHDIGLNRVNLLGHSMGGKVAMALSLNRPSLVEKLVVEDVSPCTTDLPLSQAPQYVACLKSVKFENSLNIVKARRHVSQQISDVIQDKTIRNFILTNVIQDEGKVLWKFNLDAIEKHIEKIIGFPQFETSFNGETLFVGGKLSNYIRKEDESPIKLLFPKAEIVHIRRAGHWVHHDTPGNFLQTVLTFLKHNQP